MDKQPILTITRSFCRKVQLKQYEPVDFFCAVSENIFSEESATPEKIELTSEELQKFCVTEVEKSLNEYRESVKTEIESEDSPY